MAAAMPAPSCPVHSSSLTTPSDAVNDLWYKDAIIYCLDVETFQDGNGDGIGDFRGLTQRLDHLAGLGVTCLWLLPFYPTPNRDNGYDVIDYYDVDPRLGSLGDFVEFMHQARERGMRVIADLVVNHTSNQHPWFQEARDPNSDKHDWYVWVEDKPANAAQPVIFEEESTSVWSYDEQADAHYLHRFYEHQPDLNIANPEVREEIRRIMGFWLELGVSGFRIDAAPYLIEMKGVEDEAEIGTPHEYLQEFRDFLQWRRGDAIMLAEANVSAEKADEYFRNGIHMIFNFFLNQHLFLALVREDAAPLKAGFQQSFTPPRLGQWANFLRNHDELTLDRLSDEERQEVFEALAPEDRMQIFGRGIRRRLTPMFGGDERRLRMTYSLMFSLPGTPVLRYGQEIGMGDDLSLPDRQSVRTAMQWANEQNAGFSRAAEDELARPVIDEGPYNYHDVNVMDQRRDPNSRLNWIERMIRIRKDHRAFGHGEWTVIETGQPFVFAHACYQDGDAVIAVHNLADEPCTAVLDLSDFPNGHLADLHGDQQYEPLEEDSRRVDLEEYGYRWFHLDH